MQRMRKVEDVLSWAYQQSMVTAKPAADDYVKAIGAAYRIEDLGQYPDILAFFDDEAAAEKAEAATRFRYRRPEPV